MFQRPLHRCVGHGFTNRHHPEESARRAPSSRQRGGLWWQVHCISIWWQNYKGEVFQELFSCGTGVFNNQEQWPDRIDGPRQLLHRSSFRSSVLLMPISTHPSSVELAQLVYRAVWQIRFRYRCIWKGTFFSVFFFNLTTSVVCFSISHSNSCQRAALGQKWRWVDRSHLSVTAMISVCSIKNEENWDPV